MYKVIIGQYTKELTKAMDIVVKGDRLIELHALLNKINGARDMISIAFFNEFDSELINANDELYALKQRILTKLNALTGGDIKWIK